MLNIKSTSMIRSYFKTFNRTSSEYFNWAINTTRITITFCCKKYNFIIDISDFNLKTLPQVDNIRSVTKWKRMWKLETLWILLTGNNTLYRIVLKNTNINLNILRVVRYRVNSGRHKKLKCWRKLKYYNFKIPIVIKNYLII